MKYHIQGVYSKNGKSEPFYKELKIKKDGSFDFEGAVHVGKMKRVKTCYISGKITGLDYSDVDYNFAYHCGIVEKMGFKPVNPLNIRPLFKTWFWYMVSDLFVLTFCDYVYFMENWKDSKGARIEYKYSKFLRKKIVQF